MQTQDLDFDFPENLIATERKPHSRVMWVERGQPRELSISACLNEISPDDLLVINDSKVIPARVFSNTGLEILFIEQVDDQEWLVLCPARKWPKDTKQVLPGGVELELLQKGLPQKVRTNQAIDLNYFEEHGDWPLPPYIQEQRRQRESRPSDQEMYQPAWAEKWGSLASPTASLHFSNDDMARLQSRGVEVKTITLHVGLGTFLPIHSDDLQKHKMHHEFVEVPRSTWEAVRSCKKRGGRVWALGSTVTRALEAQAQGHFQECNEGFFGQTNLFIQPGYEFSVVDVLMTNFHQPKTTLVAMVMAFADVDTVKSCYQWAVNKRFRLFSYGDLSVWHK